MLLGRILDWLFGKRYRKGWPRGVRPIFGDMLDRMREHDPELWQDTFKLPVGTGLTIWKDRYPYLMIATGAGITCGLIDDERRPLW